MNINFDKIQIRIKQLIKNEQEDLLLQVCSILKEEVYHYDWVGFYVLKDGRLKLGPYVGKPTDHTDIAIGKGICGQVAESAKTMVVQDVSQEDNYIACSMDVQSEIVVPVLKNGKFIAELDIDSHSPAPFNQKDVDFLEKVCELLADKF